MKGIYFSPYVNHKPGIFDKVKNQVHFLNKNGFETELIIMKKENKVKKIFNMMPLIGRHMFFGNIEKISRKDFIYIRKPNYFDYLFLKDLKKIKKYNNKIKIIIEIPTYPYRNEFKHKILFFIPIIIDDIIRKNLRQVVDRIVTYSPDSEIDNVKTIVLNNGYDFSRVKLEKRIISDDASIKLVAVANIEKWHGFDRLIEGLNNYYGMKRENSLDFRIDIVGNGNIALINEYKKKVINYRLDKHIVFCGERRGAELKKMLQNADIAVDSLGRHRSGIYYNSSLKGKEYLAYGLPIISGVKTDLDQYMDNFKYYLRVESNDQPIDFFNIEKFYNRIYSNSISREKIRNEIFLFGKRKFNFDTSLEPLYNFLKNKG